MSQLVTFAVEGDLATLTIDNPPVNALSPATVAGLIEAMEAFEASDAVAMVITCKGRTFVAGGDISTFDDADFSAVPLNTLLGRIEASDRPIAAALFGTVLGGGLELAMACHLRIAHPKTKLGLPEITLGLLPGSHGTQRLPRLSGLAAALEMISSGKPVSADKAKALGIVDLIDADPAAAAGAAALHAAGTKLRRASQLSIPDRAHAGEIIAQAKAAAEARPMLPALAGIAAALEAGMRSFQEGVDAEAEAFEALRTSAVSRALRHVFFAEREAQRVPGLAKDTAARPVETVGIVGVGTMGGGIAMTFANAGFPVTLVETSADALARGTGIIEKNYAGSVSRGRLTQADADARRGRMTGTTDMSALADVDLIIEAVFEDMALKLQVMEKLGAIAKPGAILATNTSTLDVDKIAAASGRTHDVLGTHFFSPAHIMKLLEVVRGAETAPDVLHTVMQLSKAIGKTAAVSGVCYGFIGNRMAEVYMREAEAMLLEGAEPAELDKAVEDPERLGLAMGPCRMMDMAGVDVGARTVNEWIASGEGPQAPSYRALCRALFEAGKFGQKTGEGYYRYEGRTPVPNQATADLARHLAKTHDVDPRTHTSQEIFERLLYPMVNEAALILMEGIAYRPGDIDVVWTSGYGFPAWRGGPLFMADEIGIGEIVARLDHYGETFGNAHGHWTVAPLLRELAASGQRLSDWRPAG